MKTQSPLPVFSLIILALALCASRPAVAQVVFTSVGTISGNNSSEAAQWHNTSVAKTHDLFGNEIYGNSGYIVFAGGTANSTFSQGSPPLTFSNLSNGVQTVVSTPAGISIANGWGGPNWALGGQFYPALDIPTTYNRLGYGGVINVPSWWGNTTIGSTTYKAAQLFTLTIGNGTLGAGSGSGVIRLGLHVYNNSFVTGSNPFVALQSTAASFNTAWFSLSTADFTHTMHFFDITGYNVGDVIEIWTTAAAVGSNSYLSAISFDVVPEPSVLSLALVAAGLLVLSPLVRARKTQNVLR